MIPGPRLRRTSRPMADEPKLEEPKPESTEESDHKKMLARQAQFGVLLQNIAGSELTKLRNLLAGTEGDGKIYDLSPNEIARLLEAGARMERAARAMTAATVMPQGKKWRWKRGRSLRSADGSNRFIEW